MKRDSDRPDPGTPEFKAWLKRKALETAERHQKILTSPDYEPYDERGLLSGNVDDLFKTSAELFPDEPEEYMPHERVRIIVDNTCPAPGPERKEKKDSTTDE